MVGSLPLQPESINLLPEWILGRRMKILELETCSFKRLWSVKCLLVTYKVLLYTRMAAPQDLPCFEDPLCKDSSLSTGTSKYARAERVVIIQHNEWGPFFHSSEHIFIQIQRKKTCPLWTTIIIGEEKMCVCVCLWKMDYRNIFFGDLILTTSIIHPSWYTYLLDTHTLRNHCM